MIEALVLDAPSPDLEDWAGMSNTPIDEIAPVRLAAPQLAANAGLARPTPKALLVATLTWSFPARLAVALAKTGFIVEAACPAGHVFAKLTHPPRLHRLDPFNELGGLLQAIAASAPDLVIPCDDRSVALLHALQAREPQGPVGQLIARSLGDPAGYSAIANKSELVKLARSLGLAAPHSVEVGSEEDLVRMLAGLSYPRVIKRDRTWSGKGVRIVHNELEAREAFRALSGRPSAFTALKLAVFEGVRVFMDRMINASTKIDCQEFIPGAPANRAVVYSNGEVIAAASVVARETTFGATGPSSVAAVIDHPDMAQTTAALGRRLGLTGLFGFDFVISSLDGRAYLLEANPRATPIAQLAFADGTHLPEAMFQMVAGQPGRAPDARVAGDLIAFFPDEWSRDPNSPYLRTAHHDVPWDEPALVRLGMKLMAQRRMAARLARLGIGRKAGQVQN